MNNCYTCFLLSLTDCLDPINCENMNAKEKVYMVCDFHKGNVNMGAANIGVEYMGDASGRILREDGTKIGGHWSSSFGWLREDLKRCLDNPENYEIIDLIGQEVPERFKLKSE